MIVSLVISFLITVVVELAVGWLLGLRDRRSLVIIFLVNVVTNPSLVLILNLFSLRGVPPWYLIAGLEAAAVAVEAFFYHKCLSRCPIHPLLLSLILNGISYLGGYLL